MKNTGSNRKTLRKAYKSIIISKIDNRSVIYNAAKPTNLKNLDTLHNAYSRIVSVSYYITPIKSLLCVIGESKLNTRRKPLTVKYFVKLKERNLPQFNNILTKNHYTYLFPQKINPSPFVSTPKTYYMSTKSTQIYYAIFLINPK